MRDLLLRMWSMSGDELLVFLELIFLKIFYLWCMAMVIKIMWHKISK